MLDSGVILEAILRQIFAVTGVLETAVWHFRDHRDVGIDPYCAEVKVLRHAESATKVVGPHT